MKKQMNIYKKRLMSRLNNPDPEKRLEFVGGDGKGIGLFFRTHLDTEIWGYSRITIFKFYDTLYELDFAFVKKQLLPCMFLDVSKTEWFLRNFEYLKTFGVKKYLEKTYLHEYAKEYEKFKIKNT